MLDQDAVGRVLVVARGEAGFRGGDTRLRGYHAPAGHVADVAGDIGALGSLRGLYRIIRVDRKHVIIEALLPALDPPRRAEKRRPSWIVRPFMVTVEPSLVCGRGFRESNCFGSWAVFKTVVFWLGLQPSFVLAYLCKLVDN